MSPNQRVLVLGSSFAGLNAALDLRRRLRDEVEVVVLDPRPRFTFIPSLVWLPFGLRRPDQVTFDLGSTYARKGVRFVNEAAAGIDLDERIVHTDGGRRFDYDRLVVATGPRLAFEKIPGLGPDDGHTQSVCNLDHAVRAGEAWQRFLADPGPVVVGTAQGGSCFGASYEFALNLQHQLARRGLADVAPVTFVTAEPFLGHFGLGGIADSESRVRRMFDRRGIEGIANAAIREVRADEMELESGRVLPFRYSMIVPPFTGVDVVRSVEGLANPMGFLPIDHRFRHPDHPEVYGAGVAVAISPPATTQVPTGVPKTGQMSETMGKTVAVNIASDLQGGRHRDLPVEKMSAVCMLDGGDDGIVFRATDVLSTRRRRRGFVTSGPHGHWVKLAFERFYLGTRRRGVTLL
ncbi:MAG: FAD-dependent oxidoreductase [Solirubrobacteraceae bacterium]|nr:FAD-dependent oxidoreductase [Solirubrobacteraceae bacterium]